MAGRMLVVTGFAALAAVTSLGSVNFGGAGAPDRTLATGDAVEATQVCEGYRVAGTATVSCAFAYPTNRALLSLLWRPILSAGWALTGVSGSGGPQVRGSDIVFSGSLAANPVFFSFSAGVPAGQGGGAELRGEAEFALDGQVNPVVVMVTPDPLLALRLHALTVESAHGAADPAGTTWRPEGTVLTNRVTSPETLGATRHLCTGWTLAGNEPLAGSDASFVMTLTNDAALTWQWRTQHRLDSTATSGGSVTGAPNGWHGAGSTQTLVAVAAAGYHFTGWTGDLPGALTNDNPLVLTLDQPRAVRATFDLTRVLPVIANGGATNITTSSAHLRGNLVSLGIPTNAQIRIYYGTADGGTTPPAWQRSVLVGFRPPGNFIYGIGGLVPNSAYFFRCTASNAAGTAWAPTSDSFTTPPPPILAVSTNAVSLCATAGTAAVSNTVEVWNAGPGLMNYSLARNASWLSVVPYAGASTGEHDRVAIVCTATNLAPGVYTTPLTVYGAYATNSPRTIAVSFTVLAAVPSLEVDPADLSAIVVSSTATVSRTFRVWNNGPGTLAYTVSNDVPWCTLDDVAGLATGEPRTITATFSAVGLATGTYSGTLWVHSPDVTNTPRAVQVRLGLYQQPVVANLAATNVTPTGAQLRGTLVSAGWPTSCQVRIYYGPSDGGDALAAWSRWSSLGNRAPGPFAWSVGGLASNTVHYYRCWSSNASGVAWAPDSTCFTTLPPTVIALSTAAFTRVVAHQGNPAPDTFEVRNAGPGVLGYSVTDNAAWLAVTPPFGVSTGEVDRFTVAYAATNLAPGVYTGQITVACSTALNSPRTIAVTLTVVGGPPSLQVDQTNLTRVVSAAAGSADLVFRVWNGGVGSVAYTVTNSGTWFSVGPPDGVSSGEQDIVTVTCSPAKLGVGTYDGTVTIASPDAANSPRTVTVGLRVQPPPVILLSTSVIVRTAVQGTPLWSDTFRLWNGGAGAMAFSVTTDVSWAWANPAAGLSTGEARNVCINYAGAVTNLAEGSHTGLVTVTAPQAVNSPQVLPFVLRLTPRPRLALDPVLVTNRFVIGGAAPMRSLRLWNAGTGGFRFSLATDAPWLTLSPTNGLCYGTTNVIVAQFATGGLSAGVHTGTVTVAAEGVADAPQTVTVVVEALASQPVVAVTPTRLDAVAVQGQGVSGVPLRLWNAARSGAMAYELTPDVPWLAATPATGVSTGEQDTVEVRFDPAGLAAGVYSGALVVASAQATNAPLRIAATFRVLPAPSLWVSTAALAWTLQQGESGTNTFSLRNGGGGALAYSLAANVPWATPVPDSGTSSGEVDVIRVVVDTTGLGAGLHEGLLTVTAPGATGTVKTIALACTVWSRPVPAAAPLRLAVAAVQGSNATAAIVEVWNAAPPQGLAYHLEPSVPWLACMPAGGTSTGEHDSIRFVFATAGMGPGTHTGLVTVAGGADPDEPLAIEVVLTVTPQPAVIAALPERVVEHVTAGTAGTVDRTVEVWNGSLTTGRMAYAVSADVPWLTIDPPDGVSHGGHGLHHLTFSGLSGLGTGVHTARVVIVSGDAANSPSTIGVTLVVDPAPPCLAVSPARLDVTNEQGQAATACTLEVWNAGNTNPLVCRALATVPWLVTEPAEAVGSVGQPALFTVRFLAAALPSGEYEGTVLLLAPGATNAPLSVGVHLTVRPQPAVIGWAPGELALTLAAGANSEAKQLTVWNAGTGAMAYAVSSDASWLTVLPAAGTATGAVPRHHDVTLSALGLDEGTHTAHVAIAADGAVNGPASVPVRLSVVPSLAAAPAFIAFAADPGTNPPGRVIQVWNAGTANPVAYTAVPRVPWLTVTTSNGTASGVAEGGVTPLTVAVDVAGLAPGVHHAAVDLIPVVWPAASQRLLVQVTLAAPGGRFAEKIVFDSYRGGNSDLWMVNPDGSGLTTLVARAGHQVEPRLSPDGLKLAFRDSATNRLVVMDLTTRAERAIPLLYGYDWLADSSGLVGQNASTPAADLWKVLLDGTAAPLFIEGDRKSLVGTDWHSGRVFYTTDPGVSSNSELRVFDPVTSTRTAVMPRDGAWRAQGNVSRDGRSLCYVKAAYGQAPAVVVAAADGLSERRVVAGGGWQYMPDFAPDGGRVVFQRSGQLCTAPSGGTSNAPTVIVPGPACNWPAWGPLFLRDPDVPVLAVEPRELGNTLRLGTEPEPRWLDVGNAGNGTLSYTVSNAIAWLRVSPAAGTSTGEVDRLRCDFQPAGLESGTYTGTLAVLADAANAPLCVAVSLTVQPPDPLLVCEPEALSNVVIQGHAASDRLLRIRNAGGGALAYGLASDVPWLSFEPASGVSTGEADTVVVRYDTAGLPSGVTSAVIIVTAGGAANAPLALPVTLTVVAPRPEPPVLAVAPLLLSTTLVEGVTAAQGFDIWNAGATVLVYTVSCADDWVSIAPAAGTSQGERDRVEVVYRTAGLAAGLHQAAVTVASPAGTQTVTATVNVLPAPRFRLSIYTNPAAGGSVGLSPAQPTNGYERGTPVTLTAYDRSGYVFTHWSGGVSSTNRAVTTVMDANKAVMASFLQLTAFRGYVTNSVTGARIGGAVVEFGRQATATGPDGYYAFTGVECAAALLRASRAGYRTREATFGPPCHTSVWRNIGLAPAFVTNVQAAQRPGTRLVEITYDFEAPADDVPPVTLEASTVGGRSWNLRPVTVTGDLGMNVVPGPGRRIVWDAGADWPGMVATQMALRVSAGGSLGTTPVFALNTREQGEWSLRAWNDRNRNGRFDPGESLAGAEVYYDGRTAANRVGVTDSNGQLRVFIPLHQGRSLFVRKVVATTPARKPLHGAVDTVLSVAWQDSDVGGSDSNAWDGVWRSSVVSGDDVSQSELGSPVYVRLAHSLTEWNLLVASEVASAEFTTRLKAGLEQASAYLYDVTDGQMKLGCVAISTGVARASSLWNSADVVVMAQAEVPPSAMLNGATYPLGARFRMGTTWKGLPPDEAAWHRAFIKQFCAYAFGLYNENADGRGNTAAWQLYRTAHPDQVPANYGVMDDPGTASELSAWHKYLPVYPASTDAARVTQQVYNRSLRTGPVFHPGWQWLELVSQRYAGSTYAEIVVPLRGYYLGAGQSTTENRPGPWFVPAPYELCRVVGGAGHDGVLAAAGSAVAAPGAITLAVQRGGGPVPGAAVLRHPADGRPASLLGRTDAAGRLAFYDAAPGDRLQVSARGQTAEHLFAAPGPGGVIVIPFPATDPREAASSGPGLLESPASASGPGAVVAYALLSESRALRLSITVDRLLAGVPEVTASLDDGTTFAAAVSLVADGLYEGDIPRGTPSAGTITIVCTPAEGEPCSTVDAFDVGIAPAADGATIYARGGRASVAVGPDVLLEDAEVLVVEDDLPPMPPAGSAFTNSVAGQVCVVLPDSVAASGTSATLNITYDAAALAGLDESSLRLFAWEAPAGPWVEVPSTLAADLDTVSASITRGGTFALFAGPSSDVTAPAAIEDLVATGGDQPWSVRLTWTAPGDDGRDGRAATYVLRFGTEPVTNWAAAAVYPLPVTPGAAGAAESVTLPMPDPDCVYYFALVARDEAGNAGAPSNPTAARSAVADEDGDGIPDQTEAAGQGGAGLDGDPDLDGLTTREEYALLTDPASWDTDGDGMSDGWELTHGFLPTSSVDGLADADGDGLSNRDEYRNGTDPGAMDSDADGIPDPWELLNGLDAISASGNQGALADPDRDGFDNAAEYTADSNPLDALSNLRIRDVRQGVGGHEVRFTSSAARLYDLFGSDDLTVEHWDPLSLGLRGAGLETVVTDTDEAPGRRFYRIGVRLPPAP